CEPTNGADLFGQVNITNAAERLIYRTAQTPTTPGVPLNEIAGPVKFRGEGMESDVIVTADKQSDQLLFNYGDVSWTSSASATNGAAYCLPIGDDWNSNGPGACPALMIVSRFSTHLPVAGLLVILETLYYILYKLKLYVNLNGSY